MLPNEDKRPFSPPQRYRLAIGCMTKNESGVKHPTKQGYFTIRRLSNQERSPSYVIDDAMQTAMCKAANVKEKPTEVPVSVIGNPYRDDAGAIRLPESILFAEMARYTGGRRVCCCGNFDTDGAGVADLRTYTKKSTKDGKREYTVLDREERVACDPKTCMWATGLHGIAKHEGVALCKPHVILTVVLHWAPSVGASAKLRTTGWSSYFGIRDSLLQVALQTGGWLHEVPLWLVHGWARNADGVLIPALHFEYKGTADDLRAKTLPARSRWSAQEAELKALGDGAAAATREFIADPADQVATQREFYPESSESIIDVEPDEVTPQQEASAQDPAPEVVPVQRIAPLFGEPVENADMVCGVLDSLGVPAEVKASLVAYAWQTVVGEAREAIPSASSCASPDEEQAVVEAMREAANNWWRRKGHAQYGAEEAAAVGEEGDPFE